MMKSSSSLPKTFHVKLAGMLFTLFLTTPVMAVLPACPQTSFDVVDTSSEDRVVRNARISDNGDVVAYACGLSVCIKDFSVVPPTSDVLKAGTGSNSNIRTSFRDIDGTGDTILYDFDQLLYVYHRATGVTELVTVDIDGNPAKNYYGEARISKNGNHVVFSSSNENMVANDSNDESDVFVRNLERKETLLVSISSSGVQGDRSSGTSENSNKEMLGISENGEFVVFVSDATNLINDDTNDTKDVYLRDVAKGLTRRVGLRPDGEELAYGADFPELSNDGFSVIFRATTYEVRQRNLYLHQLLTGKIERISVPLSGGNAEDESPSTGSEYLEVADWGRYVYFESKADDLVSGDDNEGAFEGTDIFVRDSETNQTRLLSYAQDTNGNCVRADRVTDVSIARGGSMATYSTDDIDKIYRVGLDVTPPLVDQVDVSPEEGSQMVNFQVSATLKDRVILNNAEYRIDLGEWAPMTVISNSPYSSDASADFSGTGISLGSHQVCVRTFDDFGNKGQNCTEFSIVQPVVSTDEISIKCYHQPLLPQPGEDVEYFAEVLGAGNEAKVMDAVEIWVNDQSTPASREELKDNISTVQAASGEYQTYGCRAVLQDVEVFSGWRLHATTDWSVTRAIPISKSGILENRIDIIFVPDMRTYDSMGDVDFLDGVSQLLFDGYWGDAYWRGKQNNFNFWLSPDMGKAESFEDGCDHLLPGDVGTNAPVWTWDISYAFADSAAIVHADEFRDCAPGGQNVFSIQQGKLDTVRHETGHRPFGMPDEYADDGGYYVISPYPTLYDSEANCEADLKNLDEENHCTSFISSHDDERWWRSDPLDDHLMYGNGKARSGDRRRMEWMFRKCARGDC